MAHYKHVDTSPRFLPVNLSRQLLTGTFEHVLNQFLDHEMDLSRFDARFCNDDTGASTYPPSLLLKVILKNGTRADFKCQAQKLEAAVHSMLARHRDADQRAT